MSKPASEPAVLRQLPDRERGRDDESTRLVCGGLVLAVVFLALRIVGFWP
ncbi:MAG TPA: hypothetical protein VIQ05_29105 [Tardiphaga sp.]